MKIASPVNASPVNTEDLPVAPFAPHALQRTAKLKRRFAIALSLLASLILLAGCGGTPPQKYARYLQRGKKLLDTSNPKRALLEFRSAIQLQPNEAEAYYWIAQAFLAESNVRD